MAKKRKVGGSQEEEVQRRQIPQQEDKPKKPLSPYIYFSQEFRDRIRQKYPNTSIALINKAVKTRWGQLTRN